VYFDGVDQDLTFEVGAVGWFEWFDLSDTNSVVSDVTDLCSGVIAGNAWEWRSRFSRGYEVLTPDGRLLRATDGRSPRLWPRWGLRSVRRRLPGYGGDGSSVP
jgi:hypothetical protein